MLILRQLLVGALSNKRHLKKKLRERDQKTGLVFLLGCRTKVNHGAVNAELESSNLSVPAKI